MPEGEGNATVARAVSGKVSRSGALSPTAPRICVEAQLDLETASGDLVPASEKGDARVELRPGERYTVIVNLYNTECIDETIAIRGRAVFWMSWDGRPGVTVSSDRPEVPADQVPCRLEFTLDVVPSMPISSGQLKLHHGSGSTARSRVMLDVDIAAQYYSPPAQLEEAIAFPLDEVPDRRVAYVHFSDLGGQLQVRAYHPMLRELVAELPQPTVSIADVDDEQPSRQVYSTVDDYSRKSAGRLTRWINTLLAQVPDLSVVIVEYVDSRVPWEMLTLDEQGRVLGECALVTRWTSVQLYARTVTLDPGSRTVHRGRVLRFLDRENVHATAEERELSQCSIEPCASLVELKKSLNELPEGVALVFLGCHGTFAKNEEHRTQLEDLANPSGRLTTLDLAGLARPANQPAMVINACHSARLVRGERGIEGFPEFFLATFARSFFGTLGAVDDAVAGAVGARLVRAAREPGGIQIGEFLRQLRKEAVLEFRRDKLARKYVSYFMYVFYGSAWDRLELDPVAGRARTTSP